MWLAVFWDVLCSYVHDVRVWWRRRRERDEFETPYSEWAKGEAAELLRRLPDNKR